MLELISLKEEYNVISFDFNFEGTIGQSMKQTAVKSIQILLDFIFEHQNNPVYTEYIMVDFKTILDNRNIDVNLFFNRPLLE